MHTIVRRKGARRGFSLVELVVVIGIIVLIVIMALPAVNSVVESTRRNQCQANQSKLALAMARFNASKDYLPGFRNDITTPGPTGELKGNVSWFITLLPYLGRQDVYDAIVAGNVFSVMNVGVTASAFDELNALTRCPSTATLKGYRGFGMQYLANAGFPTFGSVATTAPNTIRPYYNSSGNFTQLVSFSKNDGAIGDNCEYVPSTLNDPLNPPTPNPLYNPQSLDEVRKGDGQGATLLISETIIRRNNDTMLWDLMWPPPTMDSRMPDGTPVPSGRRRVSANVPDAGTGMAFGFANVSSVPASTQIINAGAVGLDYPTAPGGSLWPKSRHVGGCYAAFVDGSVRFLKNELAPHVYGHLVTSRSVYDASGPVGQKYTTNSIMANRYLAAPSGPVPYSLQPSDFQ
jgi:prepilin-type N-terminal cleavage/methylation domain-containing protein/prepilin-type processing-associated H-X9-DG protein